MPKPKPPDTPCQCPNPNCPSRNRVFSCASNLRRHYGQIDDCREYSQALLLSTVGKNASIAAAKAALAGIISVPPPETAMEPATFLAEEPEDVDDYFPIAETTDHIEDYEGCGFVNHAATEMDLPGYQTTYSSRREVEIRLLKLCTEMEAPLYAFEEIMQWARHAFNEGYDFAPTHATYRAQVDRLEAWMGMENQRPQEVPVTLPGKRGNDSIEVTRFDFLTQLRSLLDDPVLNRDENLVLNPDDRFQRYVAPDGLLGECLSGSWYRHAWDEMEKDGICNFMIPIILYIDKTQLSISGKLSIFPVQMSLGIFTEKVSTRCLPKCQPCLCLVSFRVPWTGPKIG